MKKRILEVLTKQRSINRPLFGSLENISSTDFDEKADFNIKGDFEKYHDMACGNNPDEDSLEQYARLIQINEIYFSSKQFDCTITDIDSVFTAEEKQQIINAFDSITLI